MNLKECYETLFTKEIIEYKSIIREVIDGIITISHRTVLFPVKIVQMKIDEQGFAIVMIKMINYEEANDEIKQQYKEAFEIKEKLGNGFDLTSDSRTVDVTMENLQRRNNR